MSNSPKVLAIVRHQDLYPDQPIVNPIYDRHLLATRVILRDQQGLIGLLFLARDGFYKLVGGGCEPGEILLDCLKRECLEEAGCQIANVKELGMIEEYRDAWKLRIDIYGYTAEVSGSKGQPKWDPEEIEQGCQLLWVKPEEAAKLLKQPPSVPNLYQWKFISHRDSIILTAALAKS